MSIQSFRSYFPTLDSQKLIYLDSAATTLKPKIVIDSQTEYYTRYNANVHRSSYALAQQSTQLYEQAREKVAKYVNAKTKEIIFTKGATESINLLAYSLFTS
ncbi:MAG TPA: aminotransferase class V-fold PLP-dependent enzyme, partial [Petrotogaceae bacterium]|nr:aminotransferase class V-fold PLP-dependent enzyme [Petrotogaceae bacterium]